MVRSIEYIFVACLIHKFCSGLYKAIFAIENGVFLHQKVLTPILPSVRELQYRPRSPIKLTEIPILTTSPNNGVIRP
jgi:hypothetical protein